MSDRYEIVPFHQHEILTVEREGRVSVVIRPIIEAMGLDWSGQLQRIKRHPVLAEGVVVIPTPSGGGIQETIAIALEHLPGVLMTISPDRIKNDAAREMVIRYQREAFRVVFEHFHGPIRIAPPKPASVSEFLRVGNALKKERAPALRAGLWYRLDQITDSWGIPRCERAIGFADPDYAEVLREFWGAIDGLEECGVAINHSRQNSQIALNLPELRRIFLEAGVPIEIDTDLMRALRHSVSPAFVKAKPVNCRDGKTRHCWLFSRTLESAEGDLRAAIDHSTQKIS